MLTRLSDRVWLTEVALGDYDVRGALVLGTTHALVWDTLSHPRDMEPYLPLIGARHLVVAYSHADWDHIWGTAGLPAGLHTGRAPVLAHRAAVARFADDGDVRRELRVKQQAEPGAWDDVVVVPPTVTFDMEHTVDLGGLTVRLHHLPGHTADCCVAAIPDLGILLAGDTVETPLPVVPHDSPLARWIAELDGWMHDPDVVVVVPAHGPVGGRDIIERTAGYLRALHAGHAAAPAGPLSPFYARTHADNLRWRP